MNFVQIILLILVAGFAGLESVLEHMQLERPIIVCTLIGLILGDLRTGLILGGTLEMMSLGWLNIGAALPPDVALAGVISSILVISGGQSIATGIAIAIPLAVAGQILNTIVRTIAVYFMHRADKCAAEGDLRGIDICHCIPMLLHFLRIAIPAFLVATFVSADVVQNILNAIPVFIIDGLTVASGFIVVVGYAMVINMMKSKYLMPFFFIGFVLAAFLNFNLIAFGILGLCLAIVYIQISPMFNTASVSIDDDLS